MLYGLDYERVGSIGRFSHRREYAQVLIPQAEDTYNLDLLNNMRNWLRVITTPHRKCFTTALKSLSKHSIPLLFGDTGASGKLSIRRLRPYV